jgi:hypothetical protein
MVPVEESSNDQTVVIRKSLKTLCIDLERIENSNDWHRKEIT